MKFWISLGLFGVAAYAFGRWLCGAIVRVSWYAVATSPVWGTIVLISGVVVRHWPATVFWTLVPDVVAACAAILAWSESSFASRGDITRLEKQIAAISEGKVERVVRTERAQWR